MRQYQLSYQRSIEIVTATMSVWNIGRSALIDESIVAALDDEDLPNLLPDDPEFHIAVSWLCQFHVNGRAAFSINAIPAQMVVYRA